MHPPDLKMLETNSGVRGSGGSFRGKSQASSSNTTEEILSQMDASLGMDDDEFLIRQVEAVNASFGLNSQTAEGVQGSKDKDCGAAVDEVNPASVNMLQQEKQKSCALGTVVENGSKNRAHVEAAEDAVCGVNPDNMHKQNCTLQEKEKSCGEGTVVQNGSKKRANVESVSEENKRDHLAKEDEDEDEDEDDEDYDDNEDEYEDEDDDDAEDEDEDEGDGGNEDKDDVGNEDVDEDDEDYDYNGWHEFVGNDCERDEDDDFDGCPPKGGRGGWSGRNGYERSVVTKVRGQGSGRGKRSRATGGSSSGKQCCNMRHYEDNTDNLRDFVCTSRIIDFSYTEDSDICGSVDVVNVTPPKDRNQQNHDDDSVDRRFTKSSSETVRCALTFATGNADVGNVVLVTPPQRNGKCSHMIEDDDEYFDPTHTDATQVHGGGAMKTGILSCAHNDETPSGESDHIVLVTPQKQYNKHNRVIEADDDFVSPPFTQTTEFEGGKACIPRKHFPSTSVTLEGPRKKKKPNTPGVLRQVTRRLHARNRCLDQSNEEHDSMELGRTLF
ncbi:unnamed protein product [Brassica oleracea]